MGDNTLWPGCLMCSASPCLHLSECLAPLKVAFTHRNTNASESQQIPAHDLIHWHFNPLIHLLFTSRFSPCLFLYVFSIALPICAFSLPLAYIYMNIYEFSYPKILAILLSHFLSPLTQTKRKQSIKLNYMSDLACLWVKDDYWLWLLHLHVIVFGHLKLFPPACLTHRPTEVIKALGDTGRTCRERLRLVSN